MASDAYGNQWYQPMAGLSNVGSYQVSGIPWVTASVAPPDSSSEPLKISFPTVSKFIVVKNDVASSAKLRVGFSANGVKNSGNYFVLAQGQSFEGELRVTDLYLLSDAGVPLDVCVVAGLTGIDRSNLPNNWSGSSGIG